MFLDVDILLFTPGRARVHPVQGLPGGGGGGEWAPGDSGQGTHLPPPR